MIKFPNCPNCDSYLAPDLIKIKILEDDYFDTYEEIYECKCGCQFVALVPRIFNDRVRVHRIEHEEKK